MTPTTIEWTDTVWNPTTGCDRVSPGCDHCYALPMARRLKAMGQVKYQRDGDDRTSGPGFGLSVHHDTLAQPLKWKKPRRVFVNSMSDLFHDQVPAEFIAQVFAVAAVTGQHTYQILTKRHARMRWLLNSEHFLHQLAFEIADLSGRRWPDDVPWPLPNVWLGVSVEDQKRADLRIPSLIRTPAKVRWLSCEPLLGPVDLTQVASGERADLKLDVVRRHQFSLDGSWSRDIPGGIDWVVAGGESGPGARPMHPSWVRKLLRQCEDNRVPFFFKQAGAWTWSVRPGDAWYDRDPDAWVSVTAGRVVDDGAAQADGGDFQGVWKVGKKAAGRQIDGITHDGYPEARR